MKKEEYKEARREFDRTAAELKKEVRQEAREAYTEVKKEASDRMKRIDEELRETVRSEKALDDGCSRHHIREAREAARKAKDDVNLEVITARADFDDEKADFRDDIADARRKMRDDTQTGTVIAKTYDISDRAQRAKDEIDADRLDSLERMDRIGRDIDR